MDAKTKRRIGKIKNDTVERMKTVNTYKEEFDIGILRYSELRYRYDTLLDGWYADGRKVEEPYTNKAGATNNRKSPVYMELQNLEKRLFEYETAFGLNSKGLKSVISRGLENKKESALERALTNGGI